MVEWNLGSASDVFHSIVSNSSFSTLNEIKFPQLRRSEVQPTVPREIYTLPGVVALLSDDNPETKQNTMGSTSTKPDYDSTTLDLASAVLSRAQTHRTHASDTRFTTGAVKTIHGAGASNKFNNILKAQQVINERRQKKAEAKLCEEDRAVTIAASLWEYDSKLKLVEVSGVPVLRNSSLC